MSVDLIPSDSVESDEKALGDHSAFDHHSDGGSDGPTNEPLAAKLRLLIWPQHEPLIAIIFLACLVGMSAYFVQRTYIQNGIVDIDSSAPLSAQFQIDLNTAEIGEIVLLPGVGEKLASQIIEYREEWGGFQSPDSLKNVPGIGERKLESLLPFLLPFERGQRGH